MTTQLVLSNHGSAHWYFLAASSVQDGAENQCVVTALSISDDSPELPRQHDSWCFIRNGFGNPQENAHAVAGESWLQRSLL